MMDTLLLTLSSATGIMHCYVQNNKHNEAGCTRVNHVRLRIYKGTFNLIVTTMVSIEYINFGCIVFVLILYTSCLYSHTSVKINVIFPPKSVTSN
jgi:hypothetical protein